MGLISAFTRDVEKQGEGVPGHDGLMHQVKQPQDVFRVAVRRTAPFFAPTFRIKPASEGLCGSPVSAQSSVVSLRAELPIDLQWVPRYARPPFLVGEEDPEEVELNDGKPVFVDDVLEKAEWCVPRFSGVKLTHGKLSDQGSDKRATEQLSFQSTEGLYRYLRQTMG
jgi:hypothetical protein